MSMIKKNKILFICAGIWICIFVLLSGYSAVAKRNGENQWESQEMGQRIERLEVWSAARNENHIYHVNYPYYYYFFRPTSEGSIYSSLEDLEDIKYNGDLKEEEIAYFINYLTNLPKQEASEDSVLSYQVYYSYYDENGEEHSSFIRGYDTFPAGWDEFIMRFNELCGGEYLTVNEEVQSVTPEFLTEVFGVTDEDVRDGTLQDVIDAQKLDIVRVTELFYIEDALDSYYASTKEELLLPYRPTELKMIDSTEEEYNAFVKDYMERLGVDEWEERESDQDYLRKLVNADTSEYIYVGRTADLGEMSPWKFSTSDEYYRMDMDAHMEGMRYSADFIYSADGKYLLVFTEMNPDTLLPFVEEY